MRGAVAVFVKTPGLSPVKTRLAATLGHQQAEQFFLLAKDAIAAMLAEARAVGAAADIELHAYWAVGEAKGVQHPLWQTDGMRRMHTGEGGLGERMCHVYNTLLAEYDFVLLLGMDSPQNTPANLLRAAEYLRTPDSLVFGPVYDGGFYLLGGNAPIALEQWLAVTYSAEDTLEKLVAQMTQPAAQIRYLPKLTDVDTQPDLAAICAEMPDEALPEQQAVIDWIQSLGT